MQKKINRFDFTSDETKMNAAQKIIGFFRDERNEEIGIIAAQDFLDFFLATFSDDIYKKGVLDSKKLFKEKFEALEIELDSLV